MPQGKYLIAEKGSIEQEQEEAVLVDLGSRYTTLSQWSGGLAMMKSTLTQLLTTTTETLKETILDQSLNSIKELQTNLTSIPSLLLSSQNILAKYDSLDDDQEDYFRNPSP